MFGLIVLIVLICGGLVALSVIALVMRVAFEIVKFAFKPILLIMSVCILYLIVGCGSYEERRPASIEAQRALNKQMKNDEIMRVMNSSMTDEEKESQLGMKIITIESEEE